MRRRSQKKKKLGREILTDRIVVACIRLPAAWKMIANEVRRIDWLASATGPSLHRGKPNLKKCYTYSKTDSTHKDASNATSSHAHHSDANWPIDRRKHIPVRYPVVPTEILQLGPTYARYPKTRHQPKTREHLARDWVPRLAWHITNSK